MRRCPSCKGERSVHLSASGQGARGWIERTCFICLGDGEIEPEFYDRLLAGFRMSKDRQHRQLTLDDEASRLGMPAEELLAKEIGMPADEYVARINLARRIQHTKESSL